MKALKLLHNKNLKFIVLLLDLTINLPNCIIYIIYKFLNFMVSKKTERGFCNTAPEKQLAN